MTPALVLAPLGAQAAAMLVDELYFHRRRGLGAWERIGHPLDTLTVVACVGWATFAPLTRAAAIAYVCLAVLSCAFVTKDEAVHAKHCGAVEHWLHAVLFVLHPLALASVAVLWVAARLTTAEVPTILSSTKPIAEVALSGQLVLASLFCVYQALYWNSPWPRTTRPE